MLSSEQKLVAVKILLRPIVKFLLRQALHFPEFVRIAKTVFLEVAESELERTGERVNPSRLSVLTGLQRHDINRLRKDSENPIDETSSVLGRVLSLWRYGEEFCTSSGRPRVLDFRGEESEFRALVEQVTTAVSAGTVRSELERLGYVERTHRGLRLIAQLQSFAGDVEGGMHLIAKDIDDLIKSGYENITSTMRGDWNLHIRTEYDNIALDRLEEARAWLLELGKEFHRKARGYLTKLDLDIARGKDGENGGGRIVVTAFSSYEFPPESEEEPLQAGNAKRGRGR